MQNPFRMVSDNPIRQPRWPVQPNLSISVIYNPIEKFIEIFVWKLFLYWNQTGRIVIWLSISELYLMTPVHQPKTAELSLTQDPLVELLSQLEPNLMEGSLGKPLSELWFYRVLYFFHDFQPLQYLNHKYFDRCRRATVEQFISYAEKAHKPRRY